jgi:hypothetical protein
MSRMPEPRELDPVVLVETVPASTGANAGLSGGFQLASCDGASWALITEAAQQWKTR